MRMLFVVAAGTMAGAPARAQGVSSPHASPVPCASVPATPPDSQPREYDTLADTISAGDVFGGTILRSIVVLQFRRGTPHAQKQTAICGVHGLVVGGRPLSAGEGIYLIRIPSDSTLASLRRAVDALRADPHVLYAGPERVLTNLTPARTPPPDAR